MRISLVVAASANDVIGVRGELPWHLPKDFKYFKAVTMGKPILMGRKTWESIGRPLPGRRNIVLTRDPAFASDGAVTVHSVTAGIAAADDANELMVIGGGEIYRLFLEQAVRVYLTRVHTEVDGDTLFPALTAADWSLTSSELHKADEQHAFDFEFQVYDRL